MRNKASRYGPWLVTALLVALIALPASGAPKDRRRPAADRLFAHLSQGVGLRYYVENPDQAPALVRNRLRALVQGSSATPSSSAPAAGGRGPLEDLFNSDDIGFPQNEESVSACRSNPKVVLEGTNDYRGLLDPEGNFTGWHLSTNGAKSLANEGLLPPVEIDGVQVPSGGDPVDVLDNRTCDAYAASLNYIFGDSPDDVISGIGMYRSDPETLKSCPGGSAPSCWPTRRVVAVAEPGHFLDKEWFDQGRSGAAGNVVWVAYADFAVDPEAPLGFTSASIYAVRCSADLSECTDPILISDDDLDVQFADVTIADNGRTYITWSEIQGELEFEPQTFIHKMRVAPAGSTEFGPERVVYEEDLAIPFGGFLHANDFRVATYPKNEVKTVNGHARAYVVWDACRYRLLDNVCEEAVIKLTYSDNDGATWSPVKTVSAGGDNYFPTIADNSGDSRLAVAWFTNRFDRIFHNRQDVELATVHRSGRVTKRQRLTRPSNESEADPLLGGFFIGDYIEVDVEHGVAYVGYNANYRHVRVLGEGFPIPQQDNYLARAHL
ncbi:hypothetical protein BH24ACT26_BH24ACT26_23140 [soil metagenome]